MLIYAVYAVLGFGLSPAIMLRVFWMPDPPPSWLSIYVKLGLAGAAGAVLGGMLGLMQSDPMPGIALIGAVAGALALSGLMGAISRGRLNQG